MSDKVHHFEIKGIGITAKVFNDLPFGRQIEFFRKIEEFKQTAKTNHFGQKRISFAKGLREFRKLYGVTEFYCINRNGPNWKDDSTEIWYKN